MSKPKIICGEGKTKSEYADSCDVNKILAKYKRIGLVEHVNDREPQYIDCTEVKDYQQAMDLCCSIQHSFEALPAKVRKKFNNDPLQMVEWVGDPENEAEAVQMGLVNKDVPVEVDAPQEEQKKDEKKEAETAEKK